ncbi:MAG: hypothetical protein Q9226_004292 [Calogaya cf. arnoldii]
MAQAQEIRVLCFGASITAGWYNSGLQRHPYAIRLKDRLRKALPSYNVEVDIDGQSGDRVVGGEYLSRLEPYFNVIGGKKGKIDWLVFQAGGNDLLSGEEPAAICEAMKKLWQISLQGSTKVMALTVTDTEDQRPETRESYTKLNEMIKSYQQEGFFVADVFSKIRYSEMSEEMRKIVWDDGLHFKPAGYDMMGDVVADRLLEVLKAAWIP